MHIVVYIVNVNVANITVIVGGGSHLGIHGDLAVAVRAFAAVLHLMTAGRMTAWPMSVQGVYVQVYTRA